MAVVSRAELRRRLEACQTTVQNLRATNAAQDATAAEQAQTISSLRAENERLNAVIEGAVAGALERGEG